MFPALTVKATDTTLALLVFGITNEKKPTPSEFNYWLLTVYYEFEKLAV